LEALIGKQSIMLEALLAGSKDNSMSWHSRDVTLSRAGGVWSDL
jgi:hypothetical protein